jgi:hypothetical protein
VRIGRVLAGAVVGLGLGALVASGPVSQAQEAGDWAVVREALNLRAGPNGDARVLATMPVGARVEVVGTAGEWLQVRFDGQTGYAAQAYLGSAPAASASAVRIHLPVPFYRQLTAVWCDPAVIQSWYEYATGRTAPDAYAFQAATWEWEAANNLGYTTEEWNHSPYALASALHHHMPDRGFNHWKSDDPTTATKIMAWFMANPAIRHPGIALIWRGDHYVLVRGVEADGDPYRDYPHATIRGVYVMDPNQGTGSWLGTDHYVPMGEWVSRYLTPVSYLTPHTGVPGDQWQNKHVTILGDWRVGPPLAEGRTPADLAAYLAAGEP